MVLESEVNMTIEEKIEYFNTVGKLTFDPKKDSVIIDSNQNVLFTDAEKEIMIKSKEVKKIKVEKNKHVFGAFNFI